MTHQQKRGLCWLIAAAMTAAMMIFVLVCTDVQYATNDDAGMLRAFLGYETGEPAHFHVFIHGLLAWPLCLVSNWFPGLPWFSYLQMAFLALSSLVISKSIMQCFVNRKKPLWLGALLAAIFLSTLCMKYITRLTFTQSAALLGAAAVAQMLSIEHDRGASRVIMGMMGALALVCLSYALRQSALLPMLGFCGLIFVLIVWEHYGLGKWAKRSLKPMLISLVIIAVAVGGMLGWRMLELDNDEARAYLDWQEANTEIMDYVGIFNVPQEAFDLVGWDQSQINMAKSWCFLDSAISTEAFQTMNDYLHQNDQSSLMSELGKAWQLFKQTANQSALDMRCLGIALLVAALCLAGAVCKRSLRLCLSVLGVLGLAVVMIAYLAMAGRLPLRALLIAALPAAAAVFALLPACLPDNCRLAPIACGVLVAAMCVWCMMDVVPQLLINEEMELEMGSPMGDLEEYAAWEPESLFLYDSTLSSADKRVFPTYAEDEMPHNVSSWGGWGLRSPESIAQFERFGIDLNNLDPYDLLRDDVYIASGQIDPPPMVVLDWLRTQIGPNIECELYSEYGFVYLFHFYEY